MIPLIIQNQFYIIQNLQRSAIPQTSNWSGTFFAVSYSKAALEFTQTLTKIVEHANQQEWSSQRTTLNGRALAKTDGPEKEGRNDANQSSSNKVLRRGGSFLGNRN